MFGLCLSSMHCGGVLYTVNILGANQALEEARLAGAESARPYEYYLARAYADKAREEAGDAEYQHASELADDARTNALRARDCARGGQCSTTPATATTPAAANAQAGAQ